MDNPLLSRDLPISFHAVRPEHLLPAVRAALAKADAEVEALVDATGDLDFDATLGRLDRALARLDAVTGAIEHLMNVSSTPELRRAHAEAQPLYERFFARASTDPRLWRLLSTYSGTLDAAALGPARRFFLERELRELEHAGASLPDDARARAEALRVELSELGTTFENHVLDSLNEFSLHLTRSDEVAGLPESSLRLARREAESRNVEGWVFTLHAPSYVPFLRYAEREDLRRRMWEAYTSVASAVPHDNRPILSRILELRRELARILGKPSYADYALELNMVGSAGTAQDFVASLTEKTEPYFRAESEELEAFGLSLGIERLEAWDLAFVAERLRLARYDVDEEAIRAYFPLDRVLDGLFGIVDRLFGVRIREADTESRWHPDVRFFELRDEDGRHRASFYLDLFPRPTKRGGAWQDTLRPGGPEPDGWEPHLALVAANFTPPSGGLPSLLTHEEVTTLFHEFGHLLHATLSEVELRMRSGTKVPRDFVELPSQILENWCWEQDVLPLFSGHVDTGEPLPPVMIEKLRASRDFRSASDQMRQLGFGAIDLDLHLHPTDDPIARAQEVLGRYAIRPEFARNAFLCSFTHVFSGGYAAAYHSYKWSEMLEADAFSRFEREGLLSRDAGESFASAILRRGLSAEPADLYREFMGRDPDIERLLERTLPRRIAVSGEPPGR